MFITSQAISFARAVERLYILFPWKPGDTFIAINGLLYKVNCFDHASKEIIQWVFSTEMCLGDKETKYMRVWPVFVR